MDFYSKLGDTATNVSITENGAVGYKSTTHALTDFNFMVSSYRNQDATKDFTKILSEKEEYVLKYLFYLRDYHEGMGERTLFRKCIKNLLSSSVVTNKDEILECLFSNIPEYGRYDDLIEIVIDYTPEKLYSFIKTQLAKDVEAMKTNKPVSLLAKWLPSENASSAETKKVATKIRKGLNASPKEYRKLLSTLRGYMKVVEPLMCKKRWSDIDYNAVPSVANIKYKNAFLRNDETRRREWLAKLSAGDKSVKINSSVNFPSDVLHMYSEGYYDGIKPYDETVEGLWKGLKTVKSLEDTIVVRDDSGSMLQRCGNTTVTAYEVATALGIFCAEHCVEPYKNKIISFSMSPKYLDFSNPQNFGSLHTKYEYLLKHSEIANTNIEEVFYLVLKTAVENHISQEELPKQILILSDMEFDSCTRPSSKISLMSTIASRYEWYGYKLPKLVFWNLCSRTKTIPCVQNDLGVLLVSGFSQNVINMFANNCVDPYDAIIKVLDSERYSAIPMVEYTGSEEHMNTSKSVENFDFLSK